MHGPSTRRTSDRERMSKADPLARNVKKREAVSHLKASETQDHKTARPKTRRKRIIIFFAAGVIVCTAIAIFVRQLKPAASQAPHSHAASPAEMTVPVVHPEKVSSTVTLDLPGTT